MSLADSDGVGYGLTQDLPPELLADNAADSLSNNNAQAALATQAIPSAQMNSTSPVHSHTSTAITETSISWQQALADWAKQSLQAGETDILQLATPEFERVLLREAAAIAAGTNYSCS